MAESKVIWHPIKFVKAEYDSWKRGKIYVPDFAPNSTDEDDEDCIKSLYVYDSELPKYDEYNGYMCSSGEYKMRVLLSIYVPSLDKRVTSIGFYSQEHVYSRTKSMVGLFKEQYINGDRSDPCVILDYGVLSNHDRKIEAWAYFPEPMEKE